MGIIRLAVALLRAWRTLDPAHWSEFADQWRNALSRGHRHFLIAGRALNAAERYEDARNVFAQAIARQPKNADAYIGLGRAFRSMGNRSEAIEAFATAYRLGARSAATRQLCRYGARDRIPAPQGGIFPVRSYAAFIDFHAVAAAPALAQKAPAIDFYIDARGRRQEDLARTIASIIRQGNDGWTCTVLVDPVGVFPIPHAEADPRFSIASSTREPVDAQWRLELSAGAILDPNALSWLVWAICKTGCDAVYADHDHYRPDHADQQRCEPEIHFMPDPIGSLNGLPCAKIMATKSPVGGQRIIAHIPRILASLPMEERTWAPTVAVPISREGRIAIIIPSKDNPELLCRCIESLIDTATQPDRVQMRIVDNSGVEQDNGLLARFADRVSVAPIRFDEPFNWSRANNLGVIGADQEHILFLNDDTEMRTRHWDDILIGLLDNPNVGIVGAKLLYPSGAIQHAGFVFGMDNGPQHEGRWMDGKDPGPGGRWQTAHSTVAVTGAFMAMRRAVLDEIGPFDEQRLAIDFSDVDMCLRARRAKFHVVYAPQLELLHFESVSRGFNRSRHKRARAKAEFEALRAKWGDALDFDPGYNPYWTRQGCSFDGFREPPIEEIVRYLGRSARPNPWHLT